MVVDKSKLGLVHIYTGDGKGKTSTGMGLVVRALGRGLKVKIIQLFKRDTGEQFFFENSGIQYLQFKPLHPYFKSYDEKEKEELIFWNEAIRDIDEYDLILIDEIGPGINWGVIPEEVGIDLIENKPKNTELILTGRDFPQSLKDKVDYVSEIKKIKHPYDEGILAREGIEF